MIQIFVNGYGWVMMGNTEKGLKFTKMKAGAKPFEEYGKELFEIRCYIERQMKCNYDLIR